MKWSVLSLILSVIVITIDRAILKNMETESIQEFQERRDDINFSGLMESEHWLVNCMSLEDENLLKEGAGEWNRNSIVGNVGFDLFSTNYVDGFNIKRKLMIVNNSGSEVDSYNFWSFMWESGCKVIVRFDRTLKRRNWLNNFQDDGHAVGEFFIRKKTIPCKYFTQLEMTIENIMEREARKITQFQYHGCLGNIASVGSTQLIFFLKMVNKKQGSYFTTRTKDTRSTCGPIVIHSVGCFKRAVSFCVLDICLDQLMETNSVSVPNVILNIRSQVSFESFSLDEYSFINKTLLRGIRMLNFEEGNSKDCYPERVSFRSRMKKRYVAFNQRLFSKYSVVDMGLVLLIIDDACRGVYICNRKFKLDCD